MVTYYNRKDIVSFGNFITKQIEEGIKIPGPDGKIRISHADVENWKVGEKVNGNHNFDQ